MTIARMTVDEALEKLRECDHYLEELEVVRLELEYLRRSRDDWKTNAEAGLDGLEDRCKQLTKTNEVIRADHALLNERLKYGVDIAGNGTLYGKEETCKLFGEWMRELLNYRRMMTPDLLQRIAVAAERIAAEFVRSAEPETKVAADTTDYGVTEGNR